LDPTGNPSLKDSDGNSRLGLLQDASTYVLQLAIFVHESMTRLQSLEVSESVLSEEDHVVTQGDTFGLITAERYDDHLECTRVLLNGLLSVASSEIQILLRNQVDQCSTRTGPEVCYLLLNKIHC
jgi:hypothetical protein